MGGEICRRERKNRSTLEKPTREVGFQGKILNAVPERVKGEVEGEVRAINFDLTWRVLH